MVSNYDDESIHQEMSKEEYTKRISAWFETIGSFLLLLKDMKYWYHFCLFGFFYVPATGKYAEVAIYQNNKPEFTYRCISYTRLSPTDVQIIQSELDIYELINQLLYRHDPSDFFLMYAPVNWDLIVKEEIIDSEDMRRLDKMYRLSEKQE